MAIDKKPILPRGFKAKAEKTSLEYRRKLLFADYAPLPAATLAAHLGIEICTPRDFPLSAKDLENIYGPPGGDSEWSALTMKAASGRQIIIHNELHSLARQQSDLMHELAHIICEHKQTTAFADRRLPFCMRDYDKVQEAEATILGAALILPRECLIWSLKKKMTHEQISDHFNASLEMVNFRINTTGVSRQLRYTR